ncbi:hypothetical protein BDV96DRAFT_639918 [Lophiotrema nucula]|uniref:Uncharacterized protein n=1 Tax=Lophiotrema nucula TaxID=690887 RepID=A0A6A5ZS71_9PLEO|nr:hypothetical protein BDV96DRAFT_639918 [Lophiotrema nucula]
MDALKKLGQSASGNKQPSNNAGQQDYGDKGVDAAEKKFGLPQNRGVNEKVTDGARDYIEKATGKDIPDKFSN